MRIDDADDNGEGNTGTVESIVLEASNLEFASHILHRANVLTCAAGRKTGWYWPQASN